MTLSKPVTRAAFVTAKLIAMSLVFAISIAVASAVCFGYTVWLFGPVDGGQYAVLNLLLLLFLVFSLAVTLLFSSIFRSSLAAGGIAFAVLVGQAIFASIPWLGEFMPGQLLGWGNGLLEGKTDTYWWAFGITAVLTPLCVYLAQYVLKKRDI
jgi:ABC-2 type transport system permease protein